MVTAQATPSRAGNMTAKEQVADQLRIVQEYLGWADSFTRLDVLLEQRRSLWSGGRLGLQPLRQTSWHIGRDHSRNASVTTSLPR